MALVRARRHVGRRALLLSMAAPLSIGALGACGRVEFESRADAVVAEMDAHTSTDGGAVADTGSPSPDVAMTLDAAASPADTGAIVIDAGSDAGTTQPDAFSPDVAPDAFAAPDAVAAADAFSPDAFTPAMDDAGGLEAYCNGRIARTDNMYLPYGQCIMELDAARIACNADPLCTICGFTVVTTGVGGTQACNDGGGMTGLRQWLCVPASAVPSGLAPI